jgi:anti-anti-sigma factor
MAQAYELEFSVLSDPGVGTVIFHANPTAEGWGELEEKITALLERRIFEWTFDVRSMRFCDSHGLGMWLKLNTRIRRAEGRVIFVLRDPSRVLDLFRLTKLDQVLLIQETGEPA